jgi:adenylate cyclase
LGNSINLLFLKRKLLTAGLIILIWILTAVFVTVHEFFFLTNYPGVLDTGPMESYSFLTSLIAALAWAIMGGALFSIIELFYMQKRLQEKSFIQVVSIKLGVYFLMLCFINFFTSLFYNAIAQSLPIWNKNVLATTFGFVTSISFWHPVTPFVLILLLTLFLIQINYKFGQGELWKYIRGKYFHPREEERIFLFLDIASSTTIAEKLGHIRFFNFINDFYKDITDSILMTRGEIVDYVGDEIIVNWRLSNGLMDCNCLRCVFDIEKSLEELTSKYEETYGFVPKFRSGLHYGRATVGEIGKIKKEITYFGDVMNTTSRIQGLCKEYNQQVVISEELMKRLPLNNYEFISLGDFQLRGRSKTTTVFGVSE